MSKLRKPTPLQAYNRIRKHFSQPGAQLSQSPRATGGPSCFYRHPKDGRPCAVGVLLDDYTARQDDDLGSVGDIFRGFGGEIVSPSDVPLGSIAHWADDETLIGFLEDAQSHHDTAGTPEDFLIGLDRAAIKRGIIKEPSK